jgi:hypothetical protein
MANDPPPAVGTLKFLTRPEDSQLNQTTCRGGEPLPSGQKKGTPITAAEPRPDFVFCETANTAS